MPDPRPLSQVCPESMRQVNGQYQMASDPACAETHCDRTGIALYEGQYQMMCFPSEASTDAEASAEVHGSIVTAGYVNTEGDFYGEAQYAGIGSSFRFRDLSARLELIAPYLRTDSETALEGQDPVRVREAHFSLTRPLYFMTLGIQNTHFGGEPNDGSQHPFISYSWVYSLGPVDTTELTLGWTPNEHFTWQFGMNGGNYSAYPWANPYPAFFTGMTVAGGPVEVTANLGVGPENEDSGDIRVLGDFLATLQASDWAKIMLNYNEGYDEAAGMNAQWRALAAYAVFNWDWFTIGVRQGYVRDEQGFMSGIPDLEAVRTTEVMDFEPFDGVRFGLEASQQFGLNRNSPDDITFGARFAYSGSTADD